MNTQKWLKRKYPTYNKIINVVFSKQVIMEYLKKYKYKLAILKKNVEYYNVGTIFLIRKHGSRNDDGTWAGSYIINGLFKCATLNMTESRYNSIDIYDESYYEILEEKTNTDGDEY